MATKKKYKLKKKFKRALIYLCTLAFVIFCLIQLSEIRTYNNSIDGRLADKGYESTTIKMIKTKMQRDDIEYLLSEDKIDYVKELLNDEYFIAKNFKTYMSYYEENSKKSFKDVIAIVNAEANRPWYEDVKTTKVENKYLVLVNKFYSLPENYDPGVIKKFSSTYAFGDVSAEETCYNAFITMAKRAKEDGITLVLTSGYRTHEYQKNLFDDLVKQKGEQYALDIAAKPGTSEHETGLALDIFTYGGVMSTFKTTKTYEWLHNHAFEYGFIERYEEGKDYLTGYAPEAWHYRYVGIDVATAIKEKGITFEEYYAFYLADE